MSKGMCTDCPRRDTCTELCPEAEAYANQDYVPGIELAGIEKLRDASSIVWPGPIKTERVKKQDLAFQLRYEGLSYRQIAENLGVPTMTVYDWLNP